MNLMIYHRLEKTGCRIHKNVVTISEPSKDQIIYYYGIKEKYIKVIPNGINIKRFNPSNFSKLIRRKYGNKILLYSGLFIVRKRIPILLKAMVYVIKEVPDAHLILTGGDALKKDKITLEYCKNLVKMITCSY